MFRKVAFSAATVLVAASLIWAANDPWKSKPYDQWDDKDLQRFTLVPGRADWTLLAFSLRHAP